MIEKVYAIDPDLRGKTYKELLALKESLFINEIDAENKVYLMEKIDSALGIKYFREDVHMMIKEGEADISDINE